MRESSELDRRLYSAGAGGDEPVRKTLLYVGLLLAIGCTLTGTVFAFIVALSDAHSAAIVAVDSDSDSRVVDGERIWSVVLNNVCDSPIKVIRVQGSCTCFKVAIDRTEVPEHESFRLIAKAKESQQDKPAQKVVSLFVKCADSVVHQVDVQLTDSAQLVMQ